MVTLCSAFDSPILEDRLSLVPLLLNLIVYTHFIQGFLETTIRVRHHLFWNLSGLKCLRHPRNTTLRICNFVRFSMFWRFELLL